MSRRKKRQRERVALLTGLTLGTLCTICLAIAGFFFAKALTPTPEPVDYLPDGYEVIYQYQGGCEPVPIVVRAGEKL